MNLKILLLMLLFSTKSIQGIAQSVFENMSLSNPHEEELYYWVENQLKIHDPRVTMIRIDSNYFVKEFKLNINALGTISVYPQLRSNINESIFDSIMLKFYTGGQMLFQKNIKLKYINSPKAYLGRLDSFFITKNDLLKNNELKLKLFPCIHKKVCINDARIDSFHIEIRNSQGTKLYEEKIKGSKISDSVIDMIKTLEVGGYILCTNIRGTKLVSQNEQDTNQEPNTFYAPDGRKITVAHSPYYLYFDDISVILK